MVDYSKYLSEETPPKANAMINTFRAFGYNLQKLQPYHVSKGSQKNYVSFLKEIDKEPKSKKSTEFTGKILLLMLFYSEKQINYLVVRM
jgi:hypothetical protein